MSLALFFGKGRGQRNSGIGLTVQLWPNESGFQLLQYGRFRILVVVLEKKNEAFSSFGLFVTKEKEQKAIILVQLVNVQLQSTRASQVALVVRNLPADAGDIRGPGLIPGLERSPGGGHGSPFQYSCLENPMHRGAWWATVHRVTKRWT